MIEAPGHFVEVVVVSMVSGGQSMKATSSSWSRAHVTEPQGTGSGPGREQWLNLRLCGAGH